MIAAIRDNNPVMVIEHKGLYTLKVRCEESYAVEIGKADLKREGTDVTILTYSKMVHFCLQAARDPGATTRHFREVVDLRTLRPLDEETIKTST